MAVKNNQVLLQSEIKFTFNFDMLVKNFFGLIEVNIPEIQGKLGLLEHSHPIDCSQGTKNGENSDRTAESIHILAGNLYQHSKPGG